MKNLECQAGNMNFSPRAGETQVKSFSSRNVDRYKPRLRETVWER